jgi:hypothetical protein
MARRTLEWPEGQFAIPVSTVLFSGKSDIVPLEEIIKKYNASMRFLVTSFSRLIDDLGFDYNARVYNDANISHTSSGTEQALTFNQERYDIREMHSTTSNTGRLTAIRAGVYMIGGHIEWAANSTGQRTITIKHTDSTPTTTVIAEHTSDATASGAHPQSIGTVYELAVNDYVELFTNQNSTGSLNVLVTGNYSPEFWIQWCSPATS